MSNPGFNLETAMATWRRLLMAERSISTDDADELESHLRDAVEAGLGEGMEAGAAFHTAVQDLGDYAVMERSYRRVYWKKVRSEHRIVDELQWRGTMLKNYLKVALRHLRLQKGYTFINVSGLALGMACSLLILLYVRDELSYDRFWPNADQIYRVVVNEYSATFDVSYPLTPGPLSASLMRDYPAVVQAARLGYRNPLAVGYRDKLFDETRIHRADSNFFEIFQLPFLEGDSRTALKEPSSVVITASIARKYFGDDDPLGKVLDFKDGITYSTPYTVTGVVEDLPLNAHFHFDFLISWRRVGDRHRAAQNWLEYSIYTYVLLDERQHAGALEAELPDLIRRYVGPQVVAESGISFDEHLAAGNGYRYFLQPLRDIHLHSNMGWEIEPNTSLTVVYFFAAIALCILLLACVNYMNLSTARSARRAKEIGVRKVLGSGRKQLISQLLVESISLTVLALAVALLLVALVVPLFKVFAGKDLTVGYLGHGLVLLFLFGFTVLVGLLAGSYPAFFLSRFRPATILKGTRQPSRAGVVLRNGLVVFQFVISTTLLVGTLIVQRQMSFMLHKELGFEKEQVVVIDKAWALGKRRDAFKQALQSHPAVVDVSAAEAVPGGLFDERFVVPEHHAAGEQYNASLLLADHDYVQTLGLEMAQGRTFSEKFATDSNAVVVNEALVKALGLQGDPIGQRLGVSDGSTHAIIGVVKDFHFKSLHHDIQPLMYFIGGGTMAHMVVRLRADDPPGTLAGLEGIWRRFVTDKPFAYAFLEDNVAAQYRAEEQIRTLFGVFSVLTILIACLGLFGLSAFMAEQRTKEIGLRKVLGASVSGIVVLLSKEFLKLVGLAFVVAIPLAYLAMHRWLAAFAYHVALSWHVFLTAGLAVLLLALFTVSYQAIRAALADPVNALRYE